MRHTAAVLKHGLMGPYYIKWASQSERTLYTGYAMASLSKLLLSFCRLQLTGDLQTVGYRDLLASLSIRALHAPCSVFMRRTPHHS